MPIDDAFATPDGTVVVVGRVSSGEVRPGDCLDLCTPLKTFRVFVKSLEVFGTLTVALPGDNVGVRISGVAKPDIQPGSRLTGG